ncbi:hypothetical protein [Halalkalibacter alkalisediminis]|uniref:Transposase n=1 Tax=Halalkalibacter alkalisediminis TaxID=935616 RepID=A0ABV6NJP0_9BACI|nr:hypothetical protein [Halalkalibacter alkalisediminis]
MVLRWARELERTSLDQLDGTRYKQAAFVPTASDYAALEKEHEKIKKLYAEQALEREILRDLLKKRTQACGYNKDCPNIHCPRTSRMTCTAHPGSGALHLLCMFKHNRPLQLKSKNQTVSLRAESNVQVSQEPQELRG